MAERRDRQQQVHRNRKLLWRLGLLFALLGFFVLLLLPGRGIFHHRSLKKELEKVARENAQLRQANISLNEEIERLKKDDNYIEELAREKHGMLKKNEEVYDFSRSRRKK